MRHIEKIQPILNENEKVLWISKPDKAPFYLTKMPNGLIFIIFGIIEFFFFKEFFNHWFGEQNVLDWPWYGYLMLTVFCSPILMGLFYPIYVIMDYKNVLYAYTDKRIIIQNGAWGIDYKITEYDKISDVSVHVGPIGEKYGTGNLHFITGTNDKGNDISEKMYAIQDPYEVFKKSKKVMLDIKSDLYYPNDLRPKTNRGFKTEYDPD